jgi:hypothetical protein
VVGCDGAGRRMWFSKETARSGDASTEATP